VLFCSTICRYERDEPHQFQGLIITPSLKKFKWDEERGGGHVEDANCYA
jgi:hypothetical protein